MANTGGWLGLYEGDWLGSVGATDPNAMYGSASFSITANATLTAVIQEQNIARGGWGIDHQTKRKKATIEDKPNQQLDEIIAKSFKQVFGKLTDKKAPKEVQKKANKIVSEYTEAYRPAVNQVDWEAFNRDFEAVQRLFALYRKEFADEQRAIEQKRIFDLIENDNLEFLLMH